MTRETMIIKVTEELEKEDFSTTKVFEIISHFKTVERDLGTYSEQNILDLFNLDMEDIRSKDRRSKITLCRHLICWYYKTKGYSHEAIGEKIDRKHCTITNSLKKVRQYYEAKDPLLMGFVYLDEQLNQILKRNV